MLTKECRKCESELPIDNFYKNKCTIDGYENSCKPCRLDRMAKHYIENSEEVLERQAKWRSENINLVRERSRARSAKYNKANKEKMSEYKRKQRQQHPQRYKAQCMANNAVQAGKIKLQPCEKCGSESSVEKHHDDYSLPLSVRFLCCICHSAWHKEDGPGLNAA